MTYFNRALSDAQLRTIIRRHPALFAAVAGAVAVGELDASRISNVIAAHMHIIDTTVQVATECSTDELAAMSFIEKLSIAHEIFAATIEARQGAPLELGELSSSILGGGTLQ